MEELMLIYPPRTLDERQCIPVNPTSVTIYALR
jgi:hypothetical protein